MSAAISQKTKINKSSQDFWHLCWKSGQKRGPAGGQGYFLLFSHFVFSCETLLKMLHFFPQHYRPTHQLWPPLLVYIVITMGKSAKNEISS